ncbi:hypothetical protein RXV86_10345 [Alisedimentitalea sp. MJ-SS2]|uniref:hypothetical protein n=1 Tax=Aliisedimentitalea sp. MJ-SS2 TaxID=3049795 RepID=UPI00290D63FD|nr:hypothetical protein [Alisedimentitalea sp. MJ-SS2]MDU8927782.1 hypothetical protein [Alisedimentitalea sp. MJ-SS2]
MTTATQPCALLGLAPVAFIADDDEVLIYYATPLTSDFVMSATYLRETGRLRLRVLDFIRYAATYEALRAGKPAQ